MKNYCYKINFPHFGLFILGLGLLSYWPPSNAWASTALTPPPLNLHMTSSFLGIFSLIIFGVAYLIVMSEEFIDLRKSKPVIFGAGIIWVLVAQAAQSQGLSLEAEAAIKSNILDYAELFLFLLVAMTYVNAMEERRIFSVLRAWLVQKNLTYRALFWITGLLAFFISSLLDNLTTGLIMCAVAMAMGRDKPKFITLSCINIVVAANAGGTFSPFGDITSLMVWQQGKLPFHSFLHIFVPALTSFLVPALIMHFSIPKEKPTKINDEVTLALGAKMIVSLFLLTIITAVAFHQYFHLPPAIGMMTGLAYLQIYGYFLKRREKNVNFNTDTIGDVGPFDVFKKIQRCEWDTLLFFYGIVLCVGGLATFGYLSELSQVLYQNWGTTLSVHAQTPANITIGVISAIIDNIPVMFAVLTMDPSMSEGQWLLVTLTTGIGGSLLSVGSAAGVALMGQTKGMYTFMSHLKWTWAIALGYVAGVLMHIFWNAALFV